VWSWRAPERACFKVCGIPCCWPPQRGGMTCSCTEEGTLAPPMLLHPCLLHSCCCCWRRCCHALLPRIVAKCTSCYRTLLPPPAATRCYCMLLPRLAATRCCHTLCKMHVLLPHAAAMRCRHTLLPRAGVCGGRDGGGQVREAQGVRGQGPHARRDAGGGRRTLLLWCVSGMLRSAASRLKPFPRLACSTANLCLQSRSALPPLAPCNPSRAGASAR